MSEPKPVLIPLLNPNEPDAVLVSIHVKEGQLVKSGDILCTLETTKSASDLEADSQGYILQLQGEVGQSLRAGQIFCYLADSPEDKLESTLQEGSSNAQSNNTLPDGLRITEPALELARSLKIDLSELPVGPLITEAAVRKINDVVQTDSLSLQPPITDFDPSAILIYGGGGHGKSIIDLLRKSGSYQIAGVVDDGLAAAGIASVMGLPLLGNSNVLPDLYQKGIRLAVNAVGGIGNLAIRIQVFQRLANAGFSCPVVIHPSAEIEPSARLSPGVQVFALAYLGSEVNVGFGSIINTGAIISHECILGSYANISPGAVLAGQVEIGPGALVGMGATINLQVKIGAKARIGNGATVKSDVPAGAIVRAGSVWPD